MDRIFLFLALRKKIIKFYTYINVIRVKNENCEFPKNYVQIFLDVYSVSLKTKQKIHRVET